MDIDDRIEPVVLARQEHLSLHTVQEIFKLGQLLREITAYWLPLTGKLGQGLGVVELVSDLMVDLNTFFEACALLKDFTGSFLVGPEIGLFGYLFLQLLDLPLFRFGVKETSELPRFEISGGPIVQSIPRTFFSLFLIQTAASTPIAIIALAYANRSPNCV